jgi:phosphatidylglycerol:prolipoprotein diacylglycerol transferase
MLPVIQIGPAALQSMMLAMLLALWLGSFIAERECNRRGIPGNQVWNIIAIAVAVSILFARIIFVLQHWSIYAAAPLQIFSLTPTALAIEYGTLFGIFAAYVYVLWRDIPLARFADAVTPGALVAIFIFAIGQFLSGDAFGAPTTLPWAVAFFGTLVHPVQLYDALAALIGLIIVWRWRASQDGLTALVATAWYSAARLFIEAFRGDALLLGNGYRLSQIVALAILLMALWLIGQKLDWTQTNADRRG